MTPDGAPSPRPEFTILSVRLEPTGPAIAMLGGTEFELGEALSAALRAEWEFKKQYFAEGHSKAVEGRHGAGPGRAGAGAGSIPVNAPVHTPAPSVDDIFELLKGTQK